jgi:hypothetical protein
MYDLRAQTAHQVPLGIQHPSSVTHLRQVDDHLLVAEGLNNTVDLPILPLFTAARFV